MQQHTRPVKKLHIISHTGILGRWYTYTRRDKYGDNRRTRLVVGVPRGNLTSHEKYCRNFDRRVPTHGKKISARLVCVLCVVI